MNCSCLWLSISEHVVRSKPNSMFDVCTSNGNDYLVCADILVYRCGEAVIACVAVLKLVTVGAEIAPIRIT